MRSRAAADELARNQRLLVEQLQRVRACLERHLDPGGPAASAPGEMPPALASLVEAFSLSRGEADILLLCAGVELDATIASLCAAIQGDPGRAHPTFGLALAALPEAEWGALCPTAPLRRRRLVELAGDSLTQGPLRIDERILHYLTGLSYLDPRLRGRVERVDAAGDLSPAHLPSSHRAIARDVAALWEREGDIPLIQLCGADPRSLRAIAAAACEAAGLALHMVRAADLPASPAEREALCVLWEREALLEGSALLVCCEPGDAPESARAAQAFVEGTQGPLLIAAREPLAAARPDAVRLFVDRPTMAEQLVLWVETLGPKAFQLDGQLERLVSHFNLARPAIHAAVARSRAAGEEKLGAALWEACRQQARPQLDELAQRIVACAGWDDLVLPEAQKQTLREIAAQQRQRARVHEAWGFAQKSRRGLGSTALFCGPSGTGKTMAAEVLAAELGLDLYRIDLSQVVSKYIGETEKNLRRIFDAAESGSAILLFDEADALFGKRSEVKDSHDRHANIEVSYLLQRMESYGGLAILTTNMKKALDPAFLRRIRAVVEFPFPAEPQRGEIWRRVFPPEAPVEGLDYRRLGRLPLAGGNIRNIALNAAFLAADAGEPVCMKHLASAARGELIKLERPLGEGELGAWT